MRAFGMAHQARGRAAVTSGDPPAGHHVKRHRVSGIALLSLLLLAGCGSNDLHLAGKGADPADITLSGKRGTVTWQWGPKSFAEAVTAISRTTTHGPTGVSGTVDLTLAGGKHVFLVGDHSTFACRHGCTELHMPALWVVAED